MAAQWSPSSTQAHARGAAPQAVAAVARFRPRSLISVLVVALLLVTLPLLAALVTAMHHMDQLSRHGLQAAVDAETATEAGGRLLDSVKDMERNALQYLAVEDGALLDAYRDRHVEFLAAARVLEGLRGYALSDGVMQSVVDEEALLYRILTAGPVRPWRERIESGFQDLGRGARQLVQANSLQTWRSASLIPKRAEEINADLMRLSAISVIATVFLVALFIKIIREPLRQIDRAIRSLGAGRFEQPIVIDRGPGDLRELGSLLDWLRLRLQEVDAQKASFLRHISHELKTPLAAVREGAALLNDGSQPERADERTRIAGIVLQNSIRLQQLIENLLQLNAAGSLTTQGRREDVDLRRIVVRVAHDHELSVKAKELAVDLDLSDASVIGDCEQLRVVVDNLFSNAVRFTPHGGRVHVTLTRERSHCVVEMRDTGPGIAPDEKEAIFEPFRQGRARASEALGGTGLGLAIVREFVRAHRGTVEIVACDTGAHVRVSLPRGAARHDD